MGNFIWSLVWLVVLVLIGWPVACIVAPFFILLSPCVACISACGSIVELLEKGVKLPMTCGQKIASGSPLC